jgi:hypothetical protein
MTGQDLKAAWVMGAKRDAVIGSTDLGVILEKHMVALLRDEKYPCPICISLPSLDYSSILSNAGTQS